MQARTLARASSGMVFSLWRQLRCMLRPSIISRTHRRCLLCHQCSLWMCRVVRIFSCTHTGSILFGSCVGPMDSPLPRRVYKGCGYDYPKPLATTIEGWLALLVPKSPRQCAQQEPLSTQETSSSTSLLSVPPAHQRQGGLAG